VEDLAKEIVSAMRLASPSQIPTEDEAALYPSRAPKELDVLAIQKWSESTLATEKLAKEIVSAVPHYDRLETDQVRSVVRKRAELARKISLERQKRGLRHLSQWIIQDWIESMSRSGCMDCDDCDDEPGIKITPIPEPPKPEESKPCECPKDVVLSRGCQCGGV
jgi:hypothetical protein